MTETISKDIKTWQVNYIATYWVRASSEDEAIDLGMEEHAKLPDGAWEAQVDYWDSENYNTLGEK